MAISRLVERGAYGEWVGDSTDTKPADQASTPIATGSIFTEADTGDVYFYSAKEGDWVKQFSFQPSA